MITVIRIISDFCPSKGGGSSHHISELCENMNCFLNKQIIITRNREDCDYSKFNFPIYKINYIELKSRWFPALPINELLFMIKVYFLIKNIVVNEKIHIIHTHGISTTSYAVIIGKLLGIPVVGMLHGSLRAYKRISGIYEILMGSILKPDYGIILDDGSNVVKLFSKIWKNKNLVVKHAINTHIFKPDIKYPSLLKKYQIKSNDFIIMSISSLIKVKNIDLAITIFNNFIKKNGINNAYLFILGDGDERKKLQKLTLKLGLKNKVKFIGQIDYKDMPLNINLSDVVIGTSLYSNVNRSIQEAMSCGKPVIIFTKDELQEDLIINGDNGFSIKNGDLHSFELCLLKLYNDNNLIKYISKNARNYIIKKRSWKKRCQLEIKVYKKILSDL